MKRSYSLPVSILILSFINVSAVFAQFSLTGEYMNRFEMRNGFSHLLNENDNPAVFVSQRARLGGIYKHEKYKFTFQAQDVRTWGNTSHLGIDTSGLLSIFEANVELFLNKKWSAKLGRQTIAYDDHRIFGTLDWAMQARRHDAAVLKFRDSTWSVDAGFAYNQMRESQSSIPYVLNNYQSFQYLWANKKHNNWNLSFLFLNNGMVNKSIVGDLQIFETIYSQTTGLRGEYKGKKWNLLGYGYYQTGKSGDNRNLNAYDICLELGYKPTKNWLFTLGGEMLSGTSQTDTSNTVNRSFNPFYGTNHRFNGYMDYFYVGNHNNSVGLIDGYFRLSYTLEKMVFSLNNHAFFSAADIRNSDIFTGIEKRDPFLGGEVDFTFLYNYTEGVSIQAGYSQLFGTNSLQELKGGSISRVNNWAYAMLIVRPMSDKKFPKVGLKM